MSEMSAVPHHAGAPVSPLAGLNLPSDDEIAAVSEAPAAGRLVLCASPDGVPRLGSALGAALEGQLNSATAMDGGTALRIGPDEWLLIADAEADPWLAARIGEAGRGAAIAVIDVSHRNAGLVIEGRGAASVLSVGCPLPLDEASFPPGKATRTVLAKAEIVLWRQARDRFRIEVQASFAPYVVALLAAAISDEAAIRRVQTP